MSDLQNEYNKAMAVLNDLAKEYSVWVKDDLKRLDDAFLKAQALPVCDRDPVVRDELFRIAHDMKGQGATFDYELVTDIGNHLCRYIERQEAFDTPQMHAIKVHIDALHRVIENHLIGSGGKEGQDLKSSVEAF